MNLAASLETELDQTVEGLLQSWQIPGLAVTVVKDDQVLLRRGYGLREVEHPGRVDEHTLFAIASNTKAYTAAAVGLLVQEGRLGWDDPVTKYLPYFRLYDARATEMLTVRDLLCHRCGLGTYAGDLLQFSLYSPREVLERVRHIPPAYPFRAGYGYCNLMFIAAGVVIEAVSGLGFDDFIRQRLFEPLGYVDTVTAARFLGGQNNIAIPHEEIHGVIQPVSTRDDAGFGAAGSIWASAVDASKWLRFQLSGGMLDGRRILDADILQETHNPHTIIAMLPEERRLFPTRHFAAYGLGWFMNDHNGRKVIRHTGGLDGMLSSTVLVPEEGIGIMVMTNKLPNMAYTALPYHLLDRLMGVDGRNWFEAYRVFEKESKAKLDEGKQKMVQARASGTHPSLPLEAFAGEYDAPIIGGAGLKVDGEGLRIQLDAHPGLSGTLTHWHYDSFMCKWDDPILGESLMPFTGDGQGHITGFKAKVREDWIDSAEHAFKRK